MKHDIRKMALAAVIPLFLLFILYTLKFLETGMDWNFTRLGVYPMEQRYTAVSSICSPIRFHSFS